MQATQKADKAKLAEEAIRQKEREISYKIKPFRIEDIVRKFNQKVFYIPDYQREDVWDYKMKSKFIESVLLGYPIPRIYVRETIEDEEDYASVTQYQIIDGSQRIRTLAGFTNDEFYLSGIEQIKELNNTYFRDLKSFRQEKFKDVTISFIILPADTPDEVENELFDRINTSNPLKAMELRRGAHTGHFNTLIRDLGELLVTEYEAICPINKHFRDRREEEELALRFFAFAKTYESDFSFEDSTGRELSIDRMSTTDFLTKFYTKENERLKRLEEDDKVAFQKEKERLEADFREMLAFVERNFDKGFRRDRSKSVARPVFEAISVGVHLAIKQEQSLLKDHVNTRWIKEKEFKNSITDKYGLHRSGKIKERIAIVRDSILGSRKS